VSEPRALLDDPTGQTYRTLTAVEPLDLTGRLPGPVELPDLLLRLAVPHVDINLLVAALPRVLDGAHRWLLERCARLVVEHIGRLDELELPSLTASADPASSYFYVYVYLCVLPDVRRYHREHGIDDDVSWRTLGDLGRNIAIHRITHGTDGFSDPGWLSLHFTGSIYHLGRLQFQRARLGGRTAEAVRTAPDTPIPDAVRGEPALSVHIPRFWGPMTPQSCDEAFAAARTFFPAHFPDERYRVATCHSWLLDDQLREYLPETSNILAFGRRFHPAYTPPDDDRSTLLFVFGDPTVPLADLPRTTRLERAIIDHLQAGRHWHGGACWLAL
jgi:hypothetical protein